MKCEGNCQEHVGEVLYYRVVGNIQNWGNFWYCERAVREDLKNGFAVLPILHRGTIQLLDHLNQINPYKDIYIDCETPSLGCYRFNVTDIGNGYFRINNGATYSDVFGESEVQAYLREATQHYMMNPEPITCDKTTFRS